MKEQTIAKFKKKLQQELKEVEQQIEASEMPETTELSNYDNHPADNASDLTDQLTEMAIDEHRSDNLEEIKRALQAIEDGTYGVCNVCGKEIPLGRLEAMPEALTCVEHAEQKDENLRPVEEEVLSASPKFSDDFEEVEAFGSSDTESDQNM